MADTTTRSRAFPKLRRALPTPLRQTLGTAYYTLANDLTLLRAPAPPPLRPGLNLFGQLTEASGMGAAGRLLAAGCREAGIPLALHPLRSYSGVDIPVEEWEALFTPEAPYAANLFVFNADCSEYFLRQAGVGVLKGRRNIAHWSWELPVFPERWRRAFDRYDEIWTISEFCRRAIAPLSPVPVRVIPHGIAPRPDEALRRADFALPEGRLLFLSMFDVRSIQSRKNPLGSLRAYCRAFPGDNGDTALVLKVSGGTAEELAPLRALAAQRRDIFLLEGVYSQSRTDALLSLCDVFLSLHRAEGFGLPIAEAMALGKCVVVTGWSGNMDFTSPENACCVKYNLVRLGEAAAPPYDKWQEWAEPNEADAALWLRRLYEEPALREELGRRGQQTIRERYSPLRCGETVAGRLRELGQL